jgi:hypothetical protein
VLYFFIGLLKHVTHDKSSRGLWPGELKNKKKKPLNAISDAQF